MLVRVAVTELTALPQEIIPPTLNLKTIDPLLPAFNYVTLAPQQRQVNVALTNSFGFGGTNSTLCFTKYQ